MRVGTTKDAECNYIRALLYGDSGTGKTTSLGTLPEKSTLIVFAERGLLPLQSRNFRTVQVNNWIDLSKVLRALIAGTTAEDGSLSVEIDGVKIDGIRTVAFDSLSEINEQCKRQIVDVDRVALIHQRTKGEATTPHGVYDDQMIMEDWGALRRRMEKAVRAINHLPVHTVFTALANKKQEGENEPIDHTIGLNGQLSEDIPAQFDLILHMQGTKDGSRRWQTFNDGLHRSKDASGTLDQFEETDWTKVFSKIKKGKKAQSAKEKE